MHSYNYGIFFLFEEKREKEDFIAIKSIDKWHNSSTFADN